MTIHDFENKASVLNQFVSEIRDVTIQKDAMRFRRNIERIGEVLSYEMSKGLLYEGQQIKTPLGTKTMRLLKESLVLCSILRAGMPLHQGVLNYFDKAESAFISAYRYHKNDADEFEVIVKYFAAPTIEDKILVLIDPMLATGKTLENVLQVLHSHGTPKEIHIISAIGSQQGVDYIQGLFPENSHLWIAAIDPHLNAKGYILPGLGDAGDLAYGVKL